jgi:DNA repair photolyase
MKSFSIFYKEVEGNEKSKCMYPTRLDTYGCGCQHDCKYCYAKSLLDFRNLWNPQKPVVSSMKQVHNAILKIKKSGIKVVRLGGMTDCFQPLELKYRATYQTIKMLNKYGIEYLIVTKSYIVANDEYMKIYDKDLAHFQITTTCLDDELYKKLDYEKASMPSKRIEAILKLQNEGYDVAIRLSPLIEEYIDFDKLNNLGIKKAQVEFLRVNHWIRKWFNVDYSKFTIKQSGYEHLPLDEKIRIIKKINIPEISVCEDEDRAYDYWKNNYNPNKDDCCNLRSVNNENSK